MSGADTLAQKAKRFVAQMPGRRESRGGTIPDQLWHDIYHAANGVTQVT